MGFDPINDIFPIIQLSQGPFVVAVHPGVPAKDMREFIAHAKKNPGGINYGSAGNGSAGHLAFEYLKLVAGINEAAQKNDWELEIPYLMGLIGTRSASKTIPGIHEIKQRNRERIVNGITAVTALEALRADRHDEAALHTLQRTGADLTFVSYRGAAAAAAEEALHG